jgi:hypothetical protein
MNSGIAPDPISLFEIEAEEYRILRDDSKKNNHIDDVVISWHTSEPEAIAALTPMMVMLPINNLRARTTQRRGRHDAKLVVSEPVSLGTGGAAETCR